MSERTWYFAQNNQRCGPVPEDELRRLLAGGQLPAQTLVWTAGQANWLPASQVSSLVQPVAGINPIYQQTAQQQGFQPADQRVAAESNQQSIQQHQSQTPAQPINQEPGQYPQPQRPLAEANQQPGQQQPAYPQPPLRPLAEGNYQPEQQQALPQPRPMRTGAPDAPQQPMSGAPQRFEAPVSEATMREQGFVLHGAGAKNAWRSQDQLVLNTHSNELPDRCIKCNRPANGLRLKKTYYWYHPAWWLTLFLGWLILAIVITVVRKPLHVQIGLCSEHFAARRKHIMTSWALAAVSVCMIVGSCVTLDAAGSMNLLASVLMTLGVLGIVVAPIYGILGAKVLTIRRVDDRYAWITSVNREYLAAMPAFEGF